VTDAFAEAAGLGNDSDDNYFGRSVTSQSQLRQRLQNSGVMRCQTELSRRRSSLRRSSLRQSKIVVAIDAQRSRRFFFTGMNSIRNHNQIRIVQVRREIQSRRAEIENFNIRIALVEGTEHLDRHWAETVIAEKNVTKPKHGNSTKGLPRGCISKTCTHNTFTRAISRPLASSV
jgi:hypothetical protein